MFTFVHKLKERPEDVKNRIAIFAAISATLLIVGIWMLVIKNKNTDEEVTKKSISEDLKPLMMIFGNAEEGFGEIQEDINSTKANN